MGGLGGILIVVATIAMLLLGVAVGVMKVLELVRRTEALVRGTPKQTGGKSPELAVVDSKTGQRLIGLMVVGVAGFLTLWVWDRALRGGGVSTIGGVAFPFLSVVGLGLILFPFDEDAQRWNYGAARPRNWSETPRTIKVTLLLALFVGIGNLIAMLAL